MSDLAVQLGWEDLVETSTSSYLVKQGVSASYVNELIEASTRVNYGQVRCIAQILDEIDELLECRRYTRSRGHGFDGS